MIEVINMELNVLENTKKKLVFEIKGEGHSLCNPLKNELNTDKDVAAAGYYIEHPDKGIPRFVIEASNKAPEKALQEAIKRLRTRNDAFLKDFLKEVK